MLMLALGLGFGGMATKAEAKTILAEEVVALTNQDRTKEGLWQLERDPLLDKAALAKLKDMGERNYFAHSSPDGWMPWDFISQAGYRYEYAGENLAIHFKSAAKQQKAWMESPTHRKNILSANYTATGVAVGRAWIEGEDALVTVQLFAKPLVQIVPVKKETFAKPEAAPKVHAAENFAQKIPSAERILGERSAMLSRRIDETLEALASSADAWKILAAAITLLTMLDLALVAAKYRHGPPRAH